MDNDGKIITFGMLLQIYDRPFRDHFGFNLSFTFSESTGFNMETFCEKIGFCGEPNQLETFITRKYGIRSLSIVRAVNFLPVRRIVKERRQS